MSTVPYVIRVNHFIMKYREFGPGGKTIIRTHDLEAGELRAAAQEARAYLKGRGHLPEQDSVTLSQSITVSVRGLASPQRKAR